MPALRKTAAEANAGASSPTFRWVSAVPLLAAAGRSATVMSVYARCARRMLGQVWQVALLGGLLLGGCPPLDGRPPASAVELGFNVGGVPTPIVSHEDPLFCSAPVFESIAGRIGSHAPALTALTDGELLAAWYSYNGPGELDGAAIYTARRLPDRDGWETPELHIDRPEADRNPVLYSEGDAVWLFQAVVPGSGWSTAHIEVQRSDNRGQTWASPDIRHRYSWTATGPMPTRRRSRRRTA